MRRSRIIKNALKGFLILTLACAMPAYAELNPQRHILDNGLTVLHVEKTDIPVVKIVLLIGSGTVDNPPELAGLASLTATLLTEGTKTLDSSELSEEIEFIGASLGASATRDYTTLNLSVLKKDIETGFGLMADVLLNPAMEPGELKRQREQVLNHLKLAEERPGHIATRDLLYAIFKGHPYGINSTGTPQSVKEIARKDIMRFYKRNFTPGNSILAVAGDLNEEELNDLIEKYLGKWVGPAPIKDIEALPSNDTKESLVLFTHKDITQATIRMGHLGVPRAHPDYWALQVMNYVLGGGGFSSRLMDRVRDDLGLAYGISSRFTSYKHSGFFMVGVKTKADAAAQVIEETLRIIRDIQNDGITEDELEGAQAFLTGSFPRHIDTLGEIANFLALIEFHDLGLDYPETYSKHINSVTIEDVKRVAGEHLDPENFVLSTVGNSKLVPEEIKGTNNAPSKQ